MRVPGVLSHLPPNGEVDLWNGGEVFLMRRQISGLMVRSESGCMIEGERCPKTQWGVPKMTKGDV
jgi:hypothetical protein